MPQCNARMLHGAYVESAWRTAQPSALRAVSCVGTCGLLGMRCALRPKAHLRICFRIGEAIGAIDGELDAVGAYDDALTLLRSEVAAELAAAQVSYAPELWAGAQPGVCPCLHPCRRRRLRLSAHVYASACVVCACVRAQSDCKGTQRNRSTTVYGGQAPNALLLAVTASKPTQQDDAESRAHAGLARALCCPFDRRMLQKASTEYAARTSFP